MKWLARHTKVNYPNGATRLQRKFAWWPVYISGKVVWLEMYEILQYCEEKIYIAMIEDKEVQFKKFQWFNLSKRIIE